MGIFNKTSLPANSKSIEQDKEIEGSQSIKYPKPKVLLVDLPETASVALKHHGFNVSIGSFGKPYKVQKNSGYQPVIRSDILPNHTEQEIVVVDLHFADLANGPDGEPHRPEEELYVWAKCDQGFIDPRHLTACLEQKVFDRIYESGGVFVVFAGKKNNIDMKIGRVQYRNFESERNFNFDVWQFISELSDMEVDTDHGLEMFHCENNSALAKLISEHLAGGEFFCTLKGGYRSQSPWVPIVKNKFGQLVGLCRCKGKSGSVIVLPQIADKANFLITLFTNILPEIAPHLFPDIEAGMWVHHPEYELARVLELRERQNEIRIRAENEISNLETELINERASNGWVQDLLTATGDQLVEAVIKALTELGFKQVVDVDKERDREGKSRREDLQVLDRSPLLIVDIKGIGNYPSDEDALQAIKHATIRMRELNRTDIDGLSIINHQRHLPPLDRENVMPFRQELIDAAVTQNLGLLTTWDLYRLVRNKNKLAWRSNDVMPALYRKGRINVIPDHYHYLGKISKAWTDKFGVFIENRGLQVGNRIAIEFPVEFEEISVESIFVNDKSVSQASINDPAGVLWPKGKPRLREGLRVFLISQDV